MTRASRPSAARQLDPDVQLLAALADPVRLAIVRELAASSEVCACDFTSCCDVRQPTVSHHLKVLKEAGIVESERHGSFVYYRLQASAAARLAGIAREILPGNVIPLSEVTRRPAQPAPAPRPS
jgi:ArsR family transcriptional regulator